MALVRHSCLSNLTECHNIYIIFLLWSRVPICAVICAISGYIWLRLLSQPDVSVTVYYEFGVWSILISCIIELCCEQLYIVAQAFLFVKLQVFINNLSNIVLQIKYYWSHNVNIGFFYIFDLFFLYMVINKTKQVLGCVGNNKHCRSHTSLYFNGIVLQRSKCCFGVFICSTCIGHSIHNVILYILLVLY